VLVGRGAHAGETAVLAGLVLGGAEGLVRARASQPALLPRMRWGQPLVAPALGVIALALVDALVGLAGIGASDLLAILGAAAALAIVGSGWARRRARACPVRIAVIGSERTTRRLSANLRAAGQPGYAVVGRIAARGDDSPATALGPLTELPALVDAHDLDLLLMGDEVPRPEVFGEVARSCLAGQVRLAELIDFTEQVLGHVPIGAMSAAWFQYILHPRFRVGAPASKRALDVAVAGALGVLALPLLAVLALLIRRDGGPVLFRQLRVGERGRPFLMLKLRTMRPGYANVVEWASLDDPRITPIGRLLRRTHLDELPQLVNVLRGEMSLVGPRPEELGVVSSYSAWHFKRLMVKPGMTGPMQVNGRGDLSLDERVRLELTYIENYSILTDLKILLMTVAAIFRAAE
jgi:exopolysaccharide biosynthesis polyprenyl glycosylphosphotransferase